MNKTIAQTTFEKASPERTTKCREEFSLERRLVRPTVSQRYDVQDVVDV